MGGGGGGVRGLDVILQRVFLLYYENLVSSFFSPETVLIYSVHHIWTNIGYN